MGLGTNHEMAPGLWNSLQRRIRPILLLPPFRKILKTAFKNVVLIVKSYCYFTDSAVVLLLMVLLGLFIYI